MAYVSTAKAFAALFVFSIVGPKQNAGSLLTAVSGAILYALSHGTLRFAFHGSFNNQLFQRIRLAVEGTPQVRKWLKKLPWRAKPRVPCERSYKTVSETAVKSDPAFCLGPSIEETNSELLLQYIIFAIFVFRWKHCLLFFAWIMCRWWISCIFSSWKQPS